MFRSFIAFIREQGIISLAIAFMLGGAAMRLVTAFVTDIINPLVGLAFNAQSLADKVVPIGSAHLRWGDMAGSVIDFLIIAAIVYFIFRTLRIEKFDNSPQTPKAPLP